jgi:hypothetical protein
MLRQKTETSRLHLTADLRAIDASPVKKLQKATITRFPSEPKRFPPVEDVVAVLDRIASRAFVA